MNTTIANQFLLRNCKAFCLIFLLLCFSSVKCFAQKNLLINKVDGSSITLDFDSNPVVKLEKEKILITGKDVSFEIERANIKSFCYEEKTPDGIADASQKTQIRIEGRVVYAMGKDAIIYDISGKPVARADKSGVLKKDMSGMPKGTYVIKTYIETLKFLNL